jgi:predicted RNA binding protein YcfA (HicA-like mRNA interferase family)
LVPRKVRELITELVRAGFVDRGGKGSHRNFLHPAGIRVTLSGRPGDEAKRYQEQEVGQRIAAARAAEGGRT